MILCTLFIATDAMSPTTDKAKVNMNKVSSITHHQVAERALGLAELGQFEQAEALLNQHLLWPYAKQSLPLLRVRAELYQCKNNFVDEVETYHHILQLIPNDRVALRNRAFATLRMNAPHLAVKYAEQHPDAFTQVELLDLHQAETGKSVKWGAVEDKAGIGRQRFQSPDKALLPEYSGMIIGTTCLLQTLINLLLDCQYDHHLMCYYAWTIWCPLGF